MISKDFFEEIQLRAKGEVKFKIINLMTLVVGYQYLADNAKVPEKPELLFRAQEAEKRILEICQSGL